VFVPVVTAIAIDLLIVDKTLIAGHHAGAWGPD